MKGDSLAGLIARSSLDPGADVVGERLGVGQGRPRRFLRVLADVVVVITDPLLTAAACGPGQPRTGAVPVGQGHLVGAEWHAAHDPVHAAALVLAAGLEVLAVLVHVAAKLARPTLGLRFGDTQTYYELGEHLYTPYTISVLS